MTQRAIYLFVFLMSFTAAQAQDGYAVFGRTSFEEEVGSLSKNAEGNGFHFTLGQQIDDLVSIEGSYGKYDYDNYTRRIVWIPTDEAGIIDISGEAESMELAMLMHRTNQLRNFAISPFLMIGYMQFDQTSAELRIVTDTIDDTEQGDRHEETFFGFGVDFAFRDTPIGLRTSYKVVGGDIETDFFHLGARLNF